MYFNSFNFIIYFMAFLLVFYLIKSNKKLIALVIFNIVFALSFGLISFILVIVITAIGYLTGYILDKYSNAKYIKYLFVLSLVFLLLPMLSFKYLFVYLGFDSILSNLPIGLSFYTFTSVSYLIEVYRKNFSPERNPILYFAYIGFFPVFISGPIERPGNLLKQLQNGLNPEKTQLNEGLILILLGFFKKVVVSSFISQFTSSIFQGSEYLTGIIFLIAGVLFAFQIYYDFSGYTDIATGTAVLMGIKLSPNFNRPYKSKSIREFWTRWHISLSFWLRDYIFLPISYFLTRKLTKHFEFKKVENIIYSVSSILTMLICGYWHGSSVNFVLWGGLFGVFLSFSRITSKMRQKILKKSGLNRFKRINNTIRILFIFLLVSLSWIVFSVSSITELFQIFTKMFQFDGLASINLIFDSYKPFLKMFIFILIIEIYSYYDEKFNLKNTIINLKPVIQYILFYVVVIVILYFGDFVNDKFIYANF